VSAPAPQHLYDQAARLWASAARAYCRQAEDGIRGLMDALVAHRDWGGFSAAEDVREARKSLKEALADLRWVEGAVDRIAELSEREASAEGSESR
jgi:hypothetical protein